jgi:hypothetical protein
MTKNILPNGVFRRSGNNTKIAIKKTAIAPNTIINIIN